MLHLETELEIRKLNIKSFLYQSITSVSYMKRCNNCVGKRFALSDTPPLPLIIVHWIATDFKVYLTPNSFSAETNLLVISITSAKHCWIR